VSVSIFGKTKKMLFKENENKLDTVKQNQAVVPNINHSLDASHLTNIINMAYENDFQPIIPIHDCFGTHPNKMADLEHRVKKEFILLYSDSQFLNAFHQRFVQSINDNNFDIKIENNESYVYLDTFNKLKIPAIPKLGELDIEKIIHSKYMIS
jgi:DNA-directed RNA polymerase, mitochondrial